LPLTTAQQWTLVNMIGMVCNQQPEMRIFSVQRCIFNLSSDLLWNVSVLPNVCYSNNHESNYPCQQQLRV